MTSKYIYEKEEKIKNLISAGDIRQALYELRYFATENGLEDRENEAIQLSSRHADNEAEASAGVKSEQEIKIEHNKVVMFGVKLLRNICLDLFDKIRVVEASEKERAAKEIELYKKGAQVLDNLHLAKIIETAEKSKLEELDLSNTGINALPREIARLQHLKKLDLSHNLFEELPPFISKLYALASLDVSFNQLERLPDELGDLVDLEELNIENNPLVYPTPDILAKGTDSILRFLARQFKLKQKGFDVIFEKLEINEVVPAIVVDKQEYGYYLSYKGVEGLLHRNNISSSKIAELENLKVGDEVEAVVNNKLVINGRRRLSFATQSVGSDNNLRINAKNRADVKIEQAIAENMRILDLSKMGFDTLSSKIGECKSLEILYLNNNILTNLPDEIGDLNQLKKLYLQNNNLRKLPENIGDLELLEIIDVENNKIDKLPAGMVKLDQLIEINIKDNPCANYFPDNDPQAIKAAIADSLLYKGENELSYSGFEPHELLLGQIKLIYNYGVFIRVIKDGNYKEGLLHKSSAAIYGKDYWRTLHKFFKIGDLLEVRILDVQPENNRVTFALHDSFPDFINNKVLNVINTARKYRSSRMNLSYAQLSTLPKEIGEVEQLEELDLRFNPIKTLPAEIKNLKNLKIIHIDNISPEIAGKGAPGIIDYFLDK